MSKVTYKDNSNPNGITVDIQYDYKGQKVAKDLFYFEEPDSGRKTWRLTEKGRKELIALMQEKPIGLLEKVSDLSRASLDAYARKKKPAGLKGAAGLSALLRGKDMNMPRKGDSSLESFTTDQLLAEIFKRTKKFL